MMNLKRSTITTLVCLTTFISQGKVIAATSIEDQVNEITEWFSGSFDNSSQVANNPNIPFLTMKNCPVQVIGNNNLGVTQPIFLEQRVGGFNGNPLRVRFYGFSEGNNTVDLGVRGFADENSLLGLCDLPATERIIEMDQIESESCDLSFGFSNNVYIANNAPDGCPTSFPGGKVVSLAIIEENSVFSLDQIFDANNNLLFGTPIQFERINEPQPVDTPESSLTFGILLWGISCCAVNLKKVEN